MKQQENITIQTLTNNDDVLIGYHDNDIVVVDSIQKFAEVNTAYVSMNAIAICTRGRIQGQVNGESIELQKNQVGIIPQNVRITDIMVSPDFDLKALFISNRILLSFLREKMSVWNELIYISHFNTLTLNDEAAVFYTHFYDMLSLATNKSNENPYSSEIIQSLLRAAVLGLVGDLKMRLKTPDGNPADSQTNFSTSELHYRKFIELLHTADHKHRTVEAYASELCISPKYLTTICKRHSGKTANQWIKEKVLEDIRYYLRQTDLSLKQICDRLAFPNTSFFGKYVKDNFGKTPLQIRRE